MTDAHNRNIFGVTVRKNSHKDIRRIKQASGVAAIHGNKFWKSTSLLIDYLQASPPKSSLKVLEIGCGWGIGGIYLAKYCNAQVTALDADDSVFAYVDYHAELNGVTIDTLKLRYEHITTAMLSEFTMVIAADICFWDEMTQPLSKLVDRCYLAGVERVVMTDPGRQPFRDMAEYCAHKYDAIYENWSVPHPYNMSGLVLDIH
ncbi:class I SAM-dependent methyltransferase [Eionea flava]